MKRNIKKIKQELRNFAKRSRKSLMNDEGNDEGKSKEQLLTEKCEIVNRVFFGNDEGKYLNPQELCEVLEDKWDSLTTPRAENAADHIVGVLKYLTDEIDEEDKPSSLAVYEPAEIVNGEIGDELREIGMERSTSGDAFLEKVDTIRSELFGNIDLWDFGDEGEILPFLRDCCRETRGREQELWEHLYDVCAYLAGESDSRPDSLEVSDTCDELEKFKFDYKADLLPKIKYAIEEDFEWNFKKGDPKAMEILKDPKKAGEWYRKYEDDVCNDIPDYWTGYYPPIRHLAGNSSLVNNLGADDYGTAEDIIARSFFEDYGLDYFEDCRKKFLGKDYQPIEFDEDEDY